MPANSRWDLFRLLRVNASWSFLEILDQRIDQRKMEGGNSVANPK